MTWLLFYSSFKQLINELHTSDMIPPCPIISSIYFYSTKHCRFVNCLRSQIGSGGSYFNSQNNATVVPHWWHRVTVNHHVRSHKAHHKSLVISCNKSALFYWVKQLSLNLPCNLMSPRLISPSRMGYGVMDGDHVEPKKHGDIFFFLFPSVCFIKSRNLHCGVVIVQICSSSFTSTLVFLSHLLSVLWSPVSLDFCYIHMHNRPVQFACPSHCIAFLSQFITTVCV